MKMEDSALKINSRLIIQEVALLINILMQGQCGQGSLKLSTQDFASLINTFGCEVLDVSQIVDSWVQI